jgi:hypothetical protein
VQKADIVKVSSPKVNPATLTLEELVHLVDVSVVSKYGADLAQLTRVSAEDMQGTIELFKHDLDSLPMQIRSAVQDVVGARKTNAQPT